MDKITDVELLLRQGFDILKAIPEPNDDEAWLYLELGMILHDLQVLRDRKAIRQGKFLVKDKLEIN